MPELDVPDYYRLAAENLDYVLGLGEQLSDALLKPENVIGILGAINNEKRSERLKGLLCRSEYHDALAVMASAHGMEEDDWFNEVVLELQNRHKVRNQCGHIFESVAFLRRELELAKKIVELLEKFKSKYNKTI